MLPRSLLVVGLVVLVIALAMTGALSVLRKGEVVEVFPLPADILDLPLPTGSASEVSTVSSQATVVAVATSTPPLGSQGEVAPVATAILQAGQDGYSGCTDTYIQFYLPTTNYCESPELSLVTSNKAATLLRFDLSSLPQNILNLDSGATVLEATLELYTVQGNQDVRMGIYLPRRAWDPCTVTWNTPWEQPGADGAADRESDPRVEATVKEAAGWMPFDVTSLVQFWLREPARNLGLIIKSLDVSVASHHIFYSSEQADVDLRPRLTIQYQPRQPTATPMVTLAPAPTLSPVAMPSQTPTAAVAATAGPTLILPVSPRVVEIHWRNEMDLGSSYPMQAIFRGETSGGTSDLASLYKLNVRAQVTAPTFDIIEGSPAAQMLEQPEDALSWSWQVEPRVSGTQTLSLDLLFSWTPAAGSGPAVTTDRGAWYQTKTIKVVKPFPYWTQIVLLRNGLLLAGLVCVGGWYVLRRRNKSRSIHGA